MKMESHKELAVRKKAMEATKEVYEVVKSFPKEETYGMRSQITRAVVSVPINIAEGWGRQNSRSYSYFLKVSWASALEVDTLLQIALDLEYINPKEVEGLQKKVEDISKMLYSIISKIKP